MLCGPCVLQQAFNATVAINHLKKLHLAHCEALAASAQALEQVPDVEIVDLSSPEESQRDLEVEGLEPGPDSRTALPLGPKETKEHCYALRSSHSEPGRSHSAVGKERHTYRSEPTSLNGAPCQCVEKTSANEPLLITVSVYPYM